MRSSATSSKVWSVATRTASRGGRLPAPHSDIDKLGLDLKAVGSVFPNGGIVEDVAGVHAELVAAGTTVPFNILDENNKAVNAKGMTGSALIVSGADKETVKLDAGRLEGQCQKGSRA
jgi:hypothetical protein